MRRVPIFSRHPEVLALFLGRASKGDGLWFKSARKRTMYVSIEKTAEFHDTDGRLCGSYHYEDPFKSFFRGLYTPKGHDVVAPPPAEHPHHKGLQFGLCASDVNFWEENVAKEPRDHQIPIGKQKTEKLVLLTPGEGIGFSQEIRWGTDTVETFHETRKISVNAASGAYVWTWRTTLVAARKVKIITSVWPGPGYCGLGLRLARDLFENGKTSPPDAQSGSTPTSVAFQGKGAEVRFEQEAKQANALFLSRYGPGDAFAFMSLGPTNNDPRTLEKGERLVGTYVVTVADR
jgi:Methane oxygenase PmoA